MNNFVNIYMDFSEQVYKLNSDINVYSNKIAQQEFLTVRKYIIERTQKALAVYDLEKRLVNVPTKKGRPTTKKIVYIRLKPSKKID